MIKSSVEDLGIKDWVTNKNVLTTENYKKIRPCNNTKGLLFDTQKLYIYIYTHTI